ncbi:MIR domain containing protein [Aphelenchoides bicaudatus]|nr:MIR domain containing protein [Aphelenchoides bicaudatus]
MLLLLGFIYLFAYLGNCSEDPSITCTSVLKLSNVQDKSRLHSHDVKYGSGSQQQSVTGTNNFDDVNSHWQILGTIEKPCQRGDLIKCGDIVRLLHLTTRCFLHSHDFAAPLSRSYQEVSCFGKDDEASDTGDYWEVMCNGDYWTDDETIQLKHKDTRKFLGVSGNQYGRPIAGQKEIVGLDSGSSYNTQWKTAEGIYMRKKDSESL